MAPRDWIRNVYSKIRLDAHQRVNHFRNYYELTRKDHMLKNLKRYKRQLQKETLHLKQQQPLNNELISLLEKQGKIYKEDDWNFWPATYHLPNEYSIFVEHFKKLKSQNQLWIMKPVSSCQGRGIFLFDKLKDISDWSSSSKK